MIKFWFNNLEENFFLFIYLEENLIKNFIKELNLKY